VTRPRAADEFPMIRARIEGGAASRGQYQPASRRRGSEAEMGINNGAWLAAALNATDLVCPSANAYLVSRLPRRSRRHMFSALIC
jgi:hypothetical protein